MANSLTGDFDVVVEIAVPIVNRVLAYQHQAVLDPHYEGPRYLHSVVVRVDDVPPRVDPHPDEPFGGHELERGMRRPTIVPLPVPRRREALLAWDFAALSRPTRTETEQPPLDEYTGVRGVAEVQLSAPTVRIPPGGSRSKVAIAYQTMAHFVPDPGSPPVPDYVHGELTVVADVNQLAWQKGNPSGIGDVIEIDVSSANLDVTFTAVWTEPPLAADQADRITTVLKNAFRSSFGSMNVPLPAGIELLRFKTLDDPAHPAFALLANLRPDAPSGPDAAHVTEVLLQDGDAFAIAAGRNYVSAALDQAVWAELPAPGNHLLTFDVSVLLGSITYRVFVDQVRIDLQAGRIVLSLDGHTTHDSWALGDVGFTVTQAVTLQLAGGVIRLLPVGDPSFTAHGGVWAWLVNRFKGRVAEALSDNSNSVINEAQPAVQAMLDPGRTLGAVLRGVGVAATLAYTSVEIRSDGIILRGTLSVPPWPPVQVGFAQSQRPDAQGTLALWANALDSWVPGGTVKKYTWLRPGASRPVVMATDEHRFIASFEAEGGSGPSQLCLAVEGSRISASGPPVLEDVRARQGQCSLVTPLPPSLGGMLESRLTRLTIVLPPHRPAGSADPPPEVLGHLAPWVGAAGGASNMLLHFADDRSEPDLAPVFGALRARTSKSAVFAVAVVGRGELQFDGLRELGPDTAFAFAEDHDGEWASVFSVRDKPATLLIDPNGEIVWRHGGKPAEDELTVALDRYLVAGAMIRWGRLGFELRQGDRAPDFAFEFAPGHELVLRRLGRTRCELVFWRSYPVCVEHLHEIESVRGRDPDRPALLAINSGEPPELARRFFDEHGFQAVLVLDPTEEITRRYGVACWPTTFSLDEDRIVQEVCYGRQPRLRRKQ